MESAIQIMLLIALTPIAGIILLFILNSFVDSYWQERNRKYRIKQRAQHDK